ncbi:hypothetical protein [Lysobacter silvisoli]|uniref:EGF-like domain-containing protein n=1 Tax=Lysobacter silvisoli TaxID=2293254 RepID=A0A371JXR0_9GAMM|nr:hypothetical protein [Lysobacter silvisoli]RDZ26455.1 hypothetical protein DX914_15760 [Lysobacter silvisoli]
MKRLVLISAFVLFACGSPLVMAKNIVIKGERGTRWCCPDGKKGPDCEKFPDSVPLGANCRLNIAIAPDPGITPQAPVRDGRDTTLKPVAEESPAPVRGKDAPKQK